MKSRHLVNYINLKWTFYPYELEDLETGEKIYKNLGEYNVTLLDSLCRDHFNKSLIEMNGDEIESLYQFIKKVEEVPCC